MDEAALHIGGYRVGAGEPCFISAEVGQAHDGSFDMACSYIDAVADAGANAIKFQTHIAAEESTPSEPWRVKFNGCDASRYDYWRRMEFSEEEWRQLAEHARRRGLVFLSSPFSVAAVDLLDRIGIAAWKIGAGELTTPDLLERVLTTGKPVLLSSGMSYWSELDAVVRQVRAHGLPVAVYQCTTAYPCPPEQTGLNVLAEMRTRYGCPVGFSDHSGTPFAGLAACALGVDLIEAHVTFSREDGGPDAPASLLLDELAHLVRGCTFIRRGLQHPVDKDCLADSLQELRATFCKKIVARHSLEKGRRLTIEDLAFRKAAGGCPATHAERFLTRVLKRNLSGNEVITEDCF